MYTGLKSHILMCHPELREKFMEQSKLIDEKRVEKRKLEAEAVLKRADGKTQLKLSFNNNKELCLGVKADPNLQSNWNRNFVRFCAEANVPFSTINHVHHLLGTFWPGGKCKIQIHTPKTVSKHTGVEATHVRDMIYSVLSDAKTRGTELFAFTSDLWTDDDKESYFGLTVHWIDQDFKMQKLVPFVSRFDSRHTGRNILIKLSESVAKLGLDGDVLRVVTMDNASNNKLAMRLSKHMDEFWCQLHTLALCVKDTFKEALKNGLTIYNILMKVQELAKFLKKSHPALLELKEVCAEKDIKFKKMKKYTNVRWNSQYDSLNSAIHLKEAFQQIGNQDKSGKWREKLLDATEYATIESVLTVLKPFKTVTKEMEGDSSPTVHKIIPLLYNLEDDLEKLTRSKDIYVAEFADIIYKHFKERFPYCGVRNVFNAMAHYLDPSQRGLVLTEYDGFLKKIKRGIQKVLDEDVGGADDDQMPPLEAQRADEDLTALERLAKKKRLCGGEADGAGPGSISDLELEFHAYEKMEVIN